ncbi:MAG: hypothetical protein WCA37_02115 [Terracidiphilus sp.]
MSILLSNLLESHPRNALNDNLFTCRRAGGTQRGMDKNPGHAVNLNQYRRSGEKWQFVPVVKENDFLE